MLYLPSLLLGELFASLSRFSKRIALVSTTVRGSTLSLKHDLQGYALLPASQPSAQ